MKGILFRSARSFIFLILGMQAAQGQSKRIEFDTSFRIAKFPSSHAYKSGQKMELAIDPENWSTQYRSIVIDSLQKRGKAMKERLGEDSIRRLYTLIWGKDKMAALSKELDEWLAYLDSNAVTVRAFTYFPAVPAKDKLKQEAYWVYPAAGDPENINLSSSFDLQDESKWVADGYHPQARFKIIFKNLLRDRLISDYNTNRPIHFKDWTEKDIRKWMEHGQDLIEKIDESGLALSDVPLSISICKNPEAQEDIDTRFKDWIGELSGAGDKIDFFLGWLWFNDGAFTSLNPLGFTSDKNFHAPVPYPGSLYAKKAAIYDQKVREAIFDCPICKAGPDTLVKLLKLWDKGKTLFPDEDSLKAAGQNKLLRESFLKTGFDLYDFVYPYRMTEDSDGYVQQYNAYRRFKRADRIDDITVKELKKTYANIPDDETGYVAVHNVGRDTLLKVTETQSDAKDQSAFMQFTDTLATSVAQLSGLLSPGVALLGKISATLFDDAKPPDGHNIVPEVMNWTNPIAGPGRGGGDTAIRFLDKKFQFRFRGIRQNVENCDTLVKAVLRRRSEREGLDCTDTVEKLIEVFMRKNKVLVELICSSGTESLRGRMSAIVKEWDKFIFERASEYVEFKKGRLRAERTFVTSTLNMQWPLGELTVPRPSDKDTGRHRTQLAYLTQLQSLKTDIYSLSYTTAKDSIPKPAGGGRFTLSPRHLITLGFGVAGTISKVGLNSVSTDNNGNLVISKDDQVMRFVAGLHIYPGKLFNPDNRFITHDRYGSSSWSRISIFLGVGIPDPLKNYYTGVSADLVPGLKLHAGAHWLWYTKYSLLNNQIAQQASAVKYGGWYIGLNIDPSTVVSKLFSVFK